MLRQSIRSSKSLALSIALGVVAAAGISGCGESSTPEEEPVVPSDVQSIRVTADSINQLAEGEFFNVDVTRAKVVYKFDYSTPIDYSRVKLVYGENQSKVLEEQLKSVEAGDYGENPQPNFHSAPDPRFSVTSDPADFGVLTQSELEQVRADGYYYDDVAASFPRSEPQSTDPDCIFAVCVICFDTATGGPVNWGIPGSFTCIFEEHKWCGTP